jgi:prevent-host-death family protein
MHQADCPHVTGRAEPHHGKARYWLLEGAIDSGAPPHLSDVETPGSDDGNRSHGDVDDDLDIPVIELGFGQINGHGTHARADLGEAAYLPSALEANLAHRGGDLQRLLTPPCGRSEFDGGRQAANHGGEVGMGTGPQQPIEGSLKAVQIHLAAGQEPLQDVDPALPQVLGDQRFGLGWEPVVVHASTISSDARAAARPPGVEPAADGHGADRPGQNRTPTAPKTILLADWARRGKQPVGWLSLDAGDNDPARFWRHAVAALDRARPGLAERVGPLLGLPAPPSYEGLITALINELAAEPDADQAVLVLDDYHLIDSEAVHELKHVSHVLDKLAAANRTEAVARARRLRPDHQRLLYKKKGAEAYSMSMDVAVSELRAHLSDYLDRAREGAEVVITDRGMPIARLLGVTATTTLERLTADGIIARSAAPRPRASGQPRPRPRRPIADIVSDQRR